MTNKHYIPYSDIIALNRSYEHTPENMKSISYFLKVCREYCKIMNLYDELESEKQNNN